MAFHPLGTARAHARPGARRRRRRPGRPRRPRRARRRRQRRPARSASTRRSRSWRWPPASRTTCSHRRRAHVLPDRPALLYANGRTYAALVPESARRPHRGRAGRLHGRVLGRERLALPRPAWTRRIWRLSAPATAATGCSTPACSASTRAPPGRRRTRSARRCSPATPMAVARLARRAARVTAARFPDVPPGKGHYGSLYLRAVDPQRRAASGSATRRHQRSGGADRSVWSTYSDAEAGAPTRSSRHCRARRRPGRMDRDRP